MHAWQVGATAVVPETLEPSLQLASAVLSQYNNDPDEVSASVSAFRKNHIAELQVGPLCSALVLRALLLCQSHDGCVIPVCTGSCLEGSPICLLTRLLIAVGQPASPGLHLRPSQVACPTHSPLCHVQVLCKTSGSSLGYGFTSTIDEDDAQ